MTVLGGLKASANTNALGGTGYTFIDADTLNKDGVNYRIQGFDAPEVEKWVNDRYKAGTAGGAVATDTLSKLANQHGYTNVRPVLDENGDQALDKFDRPLIDLVNENGESFKSRVLSSGLLDTTIYTSDADKIAASLSAHERRLAEARGEETTGDEWDAARAKIQGAMQAEGAKQQGFKLTAIDESQLAAARAAGVGHAYTGSNVQLRDYGRSLENDSLNPFSDSWEQGWIGVKEASYGMLNMLGETTGSEWVADVGEAGVERARQQIQDYGHILTDWKSVDDLGSAFQYVTNNAALSLPYMALSVGGAALGPVGLTGIASVYAGQTWNEMEGNNKNAGVAIASGVMQAALDRLGIGYVVGKVGKTSAMRLADEAVEELVRKGMPKEAAEQAVLTATRKELAGFVGDAATVARQQIQAKNVFKNLVKGAGVGAGGEAITEGLQEATGYLAAHHTGEGFDFQDLTDRALAGAIAGAALGGAFSVPTSIYDAGAWADVAVRQAPAEAERLSRAGKFAEQERAQFGRVKSIEELNAETRGRAATRSANELPSIDERVERNKQRKKDRTTSEAFFETAMSMPALWRGATRWIFNDDLQSRSRSARILADMFGGNLQRTFSGSTFENAKHHQVTIYKNMVGMPEKTYAAFNNGRQTSRKQRAKISNEIYNKLRSAIDPETGKFDPNLIPDTDPQKQALVTLGNDLINLGDKMHADQARFNPDLGYLNNYLLRYKSFDKKAIVKNRVGFINALKEEFGMTDNEAADIADAITNSFEVNDFNDALSGSAAAGRPGSHQRRSLDLAEKERFQEFMEKDMFANISNAAKSAARYTAYQEYVGDNESVINELLHNMEEEGINPAEVDKVAAQMRDYLAAESGNYKRPESAAGKRLQSIQRNFMMITTIAGLPLATISSFVEAALTMRGLTMDQIFGKDGSLKSMGTELGKSLWAGAQEVSAIATHKQVMPAATKGKETIMNLGYYDWDVGAATTTGVSEIQPWQQHIYEQFFKWTGLQGWTNFTRAARASIAGDYIIAKMDTILEGGPEKTNEVQEAEEALRNLGINVDDMLQAYRGGGTFDPASYDLLEKNFREGTFNFVNEAVALPQAANRPLIYQDPRFALFTQFQGFIATFTANHIPKLWGEYVARGTPAMKYNAFATMTTMIALGFASQYLKDLIKYGEYRDFGPDDHPFLNTSEYLQRGVRASGLLGTGERVLDQFFPLYDQRSEGPGEWLFNGITGESPALSYATRAGQAGGKLLEGDVGGAVKQGSRFVPFAGVLNFMRDWAGEKASAWNFDGE